MFMSQIIKEVLMWELSMYCGGITKRQNIRLAGSFGNFHNSVCLSGNFI